MTYLWRQPTRFEASELARPEADTCIAVAVRPRKQLARIYQAGGRHTLEMCVALWAEGVRLFRTGG